MGPLFNWYLIFGNISKETLWPLLELGNVQRLFHGTKSANVFGILSRGFLLPQFGNLSRFGLQRTNFTGLLGCGVYFANDFTTSHQYSSTSAQGSRFMFVVDVALGNVKDVFEIHTQLRFPPHGYLR